MRQRNSHEIANVTPFPNIALTTVEFRIKVGTHIEKVQLCLPVFVRSYEWLSRKRYEMLIAVRHCLVRIKYNWTDVHQGATPTTAMSCLLSSINVFQL